MTGNKFDMDKIRLHFWSVILLVLTSAFCTAASSAELRVIATIKPIHSLVASVMTGVGTPDLLIKGAGSPHNFSLRPSDARSLTKAGVVFWVGEEIEVFLIKPLHTLAASAVVVELSETPGLKLLPPQFDEAEKDQTETDGQEHTGHEHAGHEHHHLDPHFWLNPDNAKIMVGEIVKRLSLADKTHARLYAANGKALIARLDTLTTELKATLKPVRNQPFIVFHDAFQYYQQRFNLNAVGAITLSPDRAPGAKRLIKIRGKIVSANVKCVFSEPQFKPAIVKTILHNTTAKSGVLDPLGVDIPAGPAAYATLLRSLANALVLCLGRQ